MKKALVTGCSLSSGYMMNPDWNDLNNEFKEHPKIWCNQLLPHLGYDNFINNSLTGADNKTIFQKTIESMMSGHYDIILVQWSELHRINYQIGLECYSTRSMLDDDIDINLVKQTTISGKWLTNIGNKLRALTNVHWRILELVQYVNVLKELQESRGGQIFFINGGCQWSDNYFNRVDYSTPSELSEFLQQKVLQVNDRDDIEIRKLYNMIHDHYEKNGGIQEKNWLNLYPPLNSLKIDQLRPDVAHPGFKSHDLYYNYLKEKEQLQ